MLSPAGRLCRASLLSPGFQAVVILLKPVSHSFDDSRHPLCGLRYSVPPFISHPFSSTGYAIAGFENDFVDTSGDLRLSFQRPDLIFSHNPRPSNYSHSHISLLESSSGHWYIIRVIRQEKQNQKQARTTDSDKPGNDFRSPVLHRRSREAWTENSTAKGGQETQTLASSATAVTSKLEVRNTPRIW